MTTLTINHAHLFCGLGGGAKGFNAAHVRVGSMRGVFRCLGGIDVDAAAIRDFERMTGVPGTVLDLFTREQYRAFHGQEPPAGWREAGPAATAIANAMGEVLLLTAAGETFSMSQSPIWVRHVAAALSVNFASTI